MNGPLYQALASKVVARQNCIKSGNAAWRHRHEVEADTLVRDHLPRGSGFDTGTVLDWDKSSAERLYFNTEFHHMNDGGVYDGWTKHTVIVRPSLLHGFTLSISGRNRNDIKEHIHESFDQALRALPPAREIEAWTVVNEAATP